MPNIYHTQYKTDEVNIIAKSKREAQKKFAALTWLNVRLKEIKVREIC